MADELRRLAVGPPLSNIDETDLSTDVEAEAPCSCVLAQCKSLKPEYSEILTRVVVDGESVSRLAEELGSLRTTRWFAFIARAQR